MLVKPVTLLTPIAATSGSTGFAPLVSIDNIGTLYDRAGGTLSNGRTSTATVVDYQGNVVDTLPGEIIYDGGRRGCNLAPSFSLLSGWLVPPGTTVTEVSETPPIGVDAPVFRLQMPAISGTYLSFGTTSSPNLKTGKKTISLWCKKYSETDTNFRVFCDSTATYTKNFSATDDWLRVSATLNNTDSNSVIQLGINNGDDSYATDILICAIQVEQVEGLSNQNPSSLIDPDTIYNAGIQGVRYFDTENGNTVDANGVVAEGTGAAITPAPTMRHQGAATNYFLDSDNPATQIITLAAGGYICWFDDSDGLGSITLTGGATGVATAASPLTFTASGAAITFTVAGSNNIRAQVEGGNCRTSYILTTVSSVPRSADSIKLPLDNNINQSSGVALFRFTPNYDSDATQQGLLSFNDSNDSVISDSSTINTLSTTDGTNTGTTGVTWVAGDDLLIATVWNDDESKMVIGVSKNSGAWTWSSDATYDGAFSVGSYINLFYSNAFVCNLDAMRIYGGLPGVDISASKIWVEANAGSLT